MILAVSSYRGEMRASGFRKREMIRAVIAIFVSGPAVAMSIRYHWGVWNGGRRLAKPFLTPEQGFDKVGEGSGCAPGGDYAYKIYIYIYIHTHTHHLILIVCGLMETREGQQLYM